jgi:hypothetical protein
VCRDEQRFLLIPISWRLPGPARGPPAARAYVAVQMGKISISKNVFAEILRMIV